MRALVVLLVLAGVAEAKSTRSYAYPVEQVWPAAVRFLRVDEKVTIVEKDADALYLLFELVQDKRTWRGSAELVRFTDGRGRPSTRVMIQITDRPAYMEEGLLERFERKLHEELGSPPRPPVQEPPASAKDAGP